MLVTFYCVVRYLAIFYFLPGCMDSTLIFQRCVQPLPAVKTPIHI